MNHGNTDCFSLQDPCAYGKNMTDPLDVIIQENYNTPRYRTPQAIPRSPTMKGIPS